MQQKKFIISVPLYSVGESDIVNRSSIQKTFQQSVARMYETKGMHVQLDREVGYTKSLLKIRKLEDVRFFVFGKRLSFAKAREIFKTTASYLLPRLDEWEAMGYDEVALNNRVKKLIPFNDEQMVILSEKVCKSIVDQKPASFYNMDNEVLLSEPVFRPLSSDMSDFEYTTLPEALKKIRLDISEYLGICVSEKVYYGNGTYEIKESENNLIFEERIIDKSMLKNMFHGDKANLNYINRFPGDQMILSKNRQISPLPKVCVPIREYCVNAWLDNS